MSIQLNLSEAFYNKANLANNKRAFGFSFHPVSIELPQLVKHIREGKAFTVGHFQDNRRIETNFVSSQLLALDLDQCPMDMETLEALSEFIQQHTFMMYPTPSSTPEQPKTRILFVLDEPIMEPKRWRVLQLALMEHFVEVKPDEACKDPSRLFYGCDTPHYYVDYEARLPLALVGGLVLPQAERDAFSMLAAHYTIHSQRGDSDLERCAVNFLNHGLKKVAEAGQGKRHITFRNYALWLYGLEAGGWPISKSDIERGLSAIAISWGDDEKTIQNNLRWPESNCTPTPPDETKLSDRGRHVQMMQRQARYTK